MKTEWILRRARRSVTHRPWAVGALVAAFGVFTILAGATRLSSRVTSQLAPGLADNVHVIAYLRDDVDEARLAALMGLLKEVPGVKGVRRVDSQQAFERLNKDVAQIGGAAELLEGIEDGFLPRSIEIALTPSAALTERAQKLAASIRRFDGVAEVDAMEDGLASLRALLGALRWLGWGLFALALLAGTAMLGLPLLRGRDQRAEEAALLGMLGESARSIQLPWSLIGAAAALVGSALGTLVLYLGFSVLTGALGRTFGGLPDSAQRFLAPSELVVFLIAAIALGYALGRNAIPLPRPFAEARRA